MHFQSAGPHERLHAYQALIRPNIRMLPFVVCQMTLSRKRSTAFFVLASKWLFAGVDTDMRFKITVLSEAFIAHPTFEGLLASVCSQMNLQSSGSGVILFTYIALKWFFTCMDQQMSLQMPFGNKGFATIIEGAVERSITCMLTHMSFEITCFIEFT